VKFKCREEKWDRVKNETKNKRTRMKNMLIVYGENLLTRSVEVGGEGRLRQVPGHAEGALNTLQQEYNM
jgi:hypothetical protein